jgi:hypothetical protein
MTERESRFTDPDTAVDHVRRVARETATASGHGHVRPRSR